MKGNIEKKAKLKKNNLDADQFLSELVKKFITYSEKYVINIKNSSETFDLSFTERERQLQTLLVLALNDLCYAVKAEVYMKRQKKDSHPKAGRIDYWCRYPKDKNSFTDFFIEVKHGYISLRKLLKSYDNKNNNLLTSNVKKSWQKGIEQIESIKKEAPYFYLRSRKVKKSYRILLIILPVWESVDKDQPVFTDGEIYLDKKDLNLIYNSFKKINWSCTVSLNKPIFDNHITYEDRSEKYYGLFFGAIVEEDRKSKQRCEL